jgi:hypothetical protein
MFFADDHGVMLRWFAYGLAWMLVPMGAIAIMVVGVGVRDRRPAPANLNPVSPLVPHEAPAHRVAQAVAIGLSCLIIGQPAELVGALAGSWGAFCLAFIIQALGFRFMEHAKHETYWSSTRWWETADTKAAGRRKQFIYFAKS